MLKIGFVVNPGFEIMGLAAMSVFEFANYVAEERLYEVQLLSEFGGPVANSLGFTMETKKFGRGAFDTLIVTGGVGIDVVHPTVLAFIRRENRRVRRMASICTGAFILADAGLLDGRRVTTHWNHVRDMARMHPGVEVDEDRIYVIDDHVWTSAGMTAGLDLALAMLEADHGPDIARQVARFLVVYHRRAGGQSQHSSLLEIAPKSDRIQRALSHARQHLKDALTIDELADAAGISPRQFSRLFVAETGHTPAKAVENLRLEAARLMMEEGNHPIETIAVESGFADRERMRRAFLRVFGRSPQTIKRDSQRIDALRSPSSSTTKGRKAASSRRHHVAVASRARRHAAGGLPTSRLKARANAASES